MLLLLIVSKNAVVRQSVRRSAIKGKGAKHQMRVNIDSNLRVAANVRRDPESVGCIDFPREHPIRESKRQPGGRLQGYSAERAFACHEPVSEQASYYWFFGAITVSSGRRTKCDLKIEMVNWVTNILDFRASATEVTRTASTSTVWTKVPQVVERSMTISMSKRHRSDSNHLPHYSLAK